MPRLLKSFLFVSLQFICLLLIAFTGPVIPSNPILLAAELAGIGLGLWAVLAMRVGNFNITPDPFSWTVLVTTGPYRLIRHPMYLALLITSLALVADHFSPARLAIWLALLVDLVLKLNYEERILRESLAGYELYARKSYRLLPFVY